MKFKDGLAAGAMVLIMALWAGVGLGVLQNVEAITGASIMGFTVVLQHYFRKAPPPQS